MVEYTLEDNINIFSDYLSLMSYVKCYCPDVNLKDANI